MGIQRNEVEEPHWTIFDYVRICESDLFSSERWGAVVAWDIILKQVERVQHASQMIDISLYPSPLFFNAVDLLEANVHVVTDLFYYLTGIKMTDTRPMSEEMLDRLGFWNMDCYKVLKQIQRGLIDARRQLLNCLKHEVIWDVTLKVLEKCPFDKVALGAPVPLLVGEMREKDAYSYVLSNFESVQIDKDALAAKIVSILNLLKYQPSFFGYAYIRHIDFSKLLALFCQSEKAQKEYIEPWRHDFGGTRDSLIAKMEKDPKLGPWVQRYDHLSKEESVYSQLFKRRDGYGPADEEQCYNTDNWLSILTIAAVLQEYDEQHEMSDSSTIKPLKMDKNVLLTRLSVFIPNETIAKKFVEAARTMNDVQTIGLVKHYKKYGQCVITKKNTSKALWELLHEAGLYTAKYSNWSAQI